MGSLAMAGCKMLVSLSAVVLVACGGTWTSTRHRHITGRDSLLMPAKGSINKNDQPYTRKGHHVITREAGPSPDIGAVNYQQFLAERGVKEKKKNSKKEKIGRSVSSSYVAYKVKISDGSLIYLPIIKG